ncbi:hypothetical protein PUV54_16585 [Hyphococcus flavus]|uniref:Uncharacterized protein n=1 Tax=Hyphococcus flavus TaxID=1866326 RepID=A0AAF0CBQ4_9PROT|nr:hypothetical protein [Hyphococcus flavus]WDI31570.1 hypothetical protein PUV54_16585 [Hyphococcus flavus]
MSARLKKALARVSAAEDAVNAALREDYPVGASIRWVWKTGAQETTGQVLGHCYGDRIRVLNPNTNREQVIHAHKIVN